MPDLVLINGLPVDESTGCGFVVEDAASSGYTFQNGFKYNPSTQAILVSGSNSIAVMSNGLGFDSNGALCIAVEGTPAYYLGALPFDADGRLCVTANPPIAVTRGWPVDVQGRICVAGTTPPPVLATISDIVITILFGAPESAILFANLYYGLASAGPTSYTVKSTFLSDNPGLSLEDFTGIAPPSGTAPVPSFADFTVTPDPGFTSLVSDSATLGAPFCFVETRYGTGATVRIHFNVPVTAAGVNLARAYGTAFSTVEFFDGPTSLYSDSLSFDLVNVFGTFRGFARGSTPGPVCYNNGAPDQVDGSSLTVYTQAQIFVFDSDTTVNSIQFWTFEGVGAYSGSIYYAIYEYFGGLPGAILSPWAPLSGIVKTATGATVFTFPEYKYQATLSDFAALAGVNYFIVLHNGPLSNITPVDLYWESAPFNGMPSGLDFELPSGPWANTEIQHAFKICGIGGAVPTGEFYQQESNTDVYLMENGVDFYIQE